MKKKNRSMKFIISTIVLFLLIFSSMSFAKSKKKYPPYPDVWGHEIIIPDKSVIDPHIVIIKMSYNDYMIRYTTKVKKVKNDFKFSGAGYLFFNGKTIDFGEDLKELQRIENEAREDKRWHRFIIADSPKKIVFSDQSSFEDKGFLYGGCDNPFNAKRCYLIRDRDRNLVKQKILVLLLSKPIKEEIDPKCERNWNYKRKYYYRRVVIMPSSYLLPLEDDTFILVFKFIRDINGNRGVPVIRFDKTFNTKANLTKYNFFILDHSEYINVVQKSKGDDNSNHEVVADYLLKLKKGGLKDANSK